jgi:predicted DNA-binding protein (MmcQ/YjbR family)
MPMATEDVKWGQDLVFSVGKKMFCAVNAEPPHQFAFKTTPEDFSELVERPGMRPAPYLARAMWVMEDRLGEVLDRTEVERLVRQAYELVLAKLPKKLRTQIAQGSQISTARSTRTTRRSKKKASGARRSRGVPARARRRRR